MFIGARENIQSAVPPSAHNQTVSPADLPPHQTPLRIRYMFFLVKLGHSEERVRLSNSPEGQQEAARLEAEGQIAPNVRPPYETMIGLSHDQWRSCSLFSQWLPGSMQNSRSRSSP